MCGTLASPPRSSAGWSSPADTSCELEGGSVVSEISDRYRRLAAAFTDTVAGVPADRWSAQTPCDEWDARGLVGHVADSQGLLLGMVGRGLADDRPTVADDPLAAWSSARDTMQGALEDPEVAGTEFDGLMDRSRFDAAVDRFLCFDLVVHRWDLAHATGQDEAIASDDLARLREGMASFGDALHSPGVCGPALDAPDDASEQTKVLAELGRQA
jgi:uncharacterized protein (TIGR03086 family)